MLSGPGPTAERLHSPRPGWLSAPDSVWSSDHWPISKPFKSAMTHQGSQPSTNASGAWCGATSPRRARVLMRRDSEIRRRTNPLSSDPLRPRIAMGGRKGRVEVFAERRHPRDQHGTNQCVRGRTPTVDSRDARGRATGSATRLLDALDQMSGHEAVEAEQVVLDRQHCRCRTPAPPPPSHRRGERVCSRAGPPTAQQARRRRRADGLELRYMDVPGPQLRTGSERVPVRIDSASSCAPSTGCQHLPAPASPRSDLGWGAASNVTRRRNAGAAYHYRVNGCAGVPLLRARVRR